MKRPQSVGPYAAGIGLAALACLLQWAMFPWAGSQAPFLFIVPAVALAAVSLGRGPASLVLAAGALNASLLYAPVGRVAIASIEGRFALCAYLLVGAAIVWYGGRLRLTTRRAALAESRLRMAQEDTGIGVFELDFLANTAFVSPSLCQLLDQPVQTGAIALDDWLHRLHPSHVQETRRVLQDKVARGELRYEREQRVELNDGKVRWLLSRIRLEVTTQGALAQARGATVDITRRKELDERLELAQAELRRQVADLQRLHRLSQQLVGAADDLAEPLQSLLELVLDFHGAQHGLLSLYDSQHAGKVVAHLGLSEYTLAQAALITDNHAGADSKGRADAAPGANGSVRLLDAYRVLAQHAGFRAVHSTALQSATGQVMGVLTVMFKQPHEPSEREIQLSELCAATAAAVVERERARAVAAQNEQRFAVTLQSSAVPFNILAPVRDEQGHIVDLRWTYINLAAARTLQGRAEDFVGKRVTELLPRNWETPGLLAKYSAVIERGEPGEFEVQSVNQPDLWWHVIASPLDGAAAIWYADISEMKRQERALHEADRRKDEFLATLAHELRNPLAPIRQAARIARAPLSTEAQKRWSHDLIERQVQNMALLLDDLLDVSRITRGTLLLRKDRVTLSSVIDAAVETSRPHIEAKGHRLMIDMPQPGLLLEIDPLRMAQVVGNLLTNAAKYTDAGGSVALRARREADALLIRVTDSGVGLAADHIARLFEMFSQLPSATGRSQGGLGIGLSMSRGLVRLHGGDIEATSAGVGHGSEFTVRLPASCIVQSVPASGSSADNAPLRAVANARAGARVLVADDNVDAAESLAELLRLVGYEVHVAHDGEQALAAFKRCEPDVALLDVGMPRMTGLQVARAIRSLPAGQRTILLAVTGWGQPRDRLEALAAGFDHHITKPVDPSEIQSLIAGSPANAATRVTRLGIVP